MYVEYARDVEIRKAEMLANAQGDPFAIEYDGKSTFDGTLLQRIGWTLLCNLITAITLGIMYPTALCLKMRWQVNHTLYNGKRLAFDGKGIQLFGKWICWVLLTIVTLGIYSIFVSKKLEAWKAKHTHIAGEFKALGGTYDGKVLVSWLYDLLCRLLCVVTFGIALPAAICIKLKWKTKHTVYDGRRLAFDGRGMQLFGNYIKWWLLSLITLGIYSWWIPNRLIKWQAKHTTLSEKQELVL